MNEDDNVEDEVEDDDVEKDEDHDVEEDNVEEELWGGWWQGWCRAPDWAQNADTHTLCEPAQSKYTSTFHKSHFIRKFAGKMPRPKTTSQTLCEPAQSKPKFAGKMSRRESAQNADSHFVRACAVDMHVNISQEPLFTEIYRAWAQNADTYFVRACAVETHVKISQEQLYTEIYGKNAEAQSEHPDQAPAFTATVRTRQCGHTVWGNIYIYL